MDIPNEVNERDFVQALDEITALLPMYSYMWDGSKLAVTLSFDPRLETPPIANYLAAKGILHRFPSLQMLFATWADVSAEDLAELYKTGEACPFRTKSGKIACPARRGGICSLATASAACPWKPCKVEAKRADRLARAHDKATRAIFSDSVELELKSQGTEPAKVKAEPNGRKKEVNLEVKLKLADIEKRENVHYSRELTATDRLYHDVCHSLAEAGNRFVTPGMIYSALYGSNDYNLEQIAEIRASIDKMQHTWVFIDNHQEIEAGYHYPKYKEGGWLIPWRIGEAEYNGQVCEGYRVTEPLPLPEFAKGRNQISYYSANLLLTAGKTNKRTPQKNRIEAYILDQVALQTRHYSLELETIYKGCEITRNKQRAKATILKVFENLRLNGVILSYKTEGEGTEDKITWKPVKTKAVRKRKKGTEKKAVRKQKPPKQ